MPCATERRAASGGEQRRTQSVQSVVQHPDDRVGSACGERPRLFLPLPGEPPASFCCFSSSPSRNRRNAATAASSALIPATFSAKYVCVCSFKVVAKVPSR